VCTTRFWSSGTLKVLIIRYAQSLDHRVRSKSWSSGTLKGLDLQVRSKSWSSGTLKVLIIRYAQSQTIEKDGQNLYIYILGLSCHFAKPTKSLPEHGYYKSLTWISRNNIWNICIQLRSSQHFHVMKYC
jgi:hypothetical protein